MKTKNALAFWCNLKGNYDVIVFDNKKNLTKYAKAYKEIYDKAINDDLTFDEFDCLADNLAQTMWDNIIKVIDEILGRDLDSITAYIDDIEYKINIVEKLDYGF